MFHPGSGDLLHGDALSYSQEDNGLQLYSLPKRGPVLGIERGWSKFPL
jgi:hypothetical protein